jgi:GT2 family glycosyltransferase
MSLRVSVIIVNYNVKEFLLSCIKSIYNNMKRDEVEIIVVDNASTDNSEQAVKNQFPDVVWISNNYNAGFSEANNQGMNIAKSPVLFLLNPDTELTDGALEGLIEKQKEFPIAYLCLNYLIRMVVCKFLAGGSLRSGISFLNH